MAYETRQKKISGFTTDNDITNASSFPYVKAGVNKISSWENILDKIAAVYGLGVKLFEDESAMVADSNLSIGDHAIVEGNRYAIYEISNVAATTNDVTLANALIATYQGRIINSDSASYADLKSFNHTLLKNDETSNVAYRATKNDGGGGTFRWDSSDNSANVTADPGQGIYVPPDSDTSGVSGCWVRQYSGAAKAIWFLSGAHEDAIMNCHLTSGDVDLEDRSWVLTGPVNITAGGVDVFGSRARMSFSASYDTVGGTILKMIEVQGVDDVNIYGIDFDMTPYAGLVGGGGSFGIRYLINSNRGHVHHCTFLNQEYPSLASVTSASGSSEIVVSDCRFTCDDIAYGGGAILHSGARCLATNNVTRDLSDTHISLDNSIYSVCSHNVCINKILDGGVLRATGVVIQVAQGSIGCIVSNNTLTGVPLEGIKVFDSVGNEQSNIIISNNIIDGGGVTNASAPTVFISCDTDSLNIDISGNRMYNPSGTQAGSYGIQARNRNVRIFNNYIECASMTRGINISHNSTDDEYIHVYDNRIIGNTSTTAQGIRFSAGDYNNTMQLQCYNNNIENCIEALYVDATNFIPKIKDNNFKGNTTKVAGAWQYNTYFNSHASDERFGSEINSINVQLWGTAAPTTGTWTVGDVIRNTVVPAGGTLMWVCTTSGTPGVWQGHAMP